MDKKEIIKLLTENTEVVVGLNEGKERIYQVRLTMMQWRELMRDGGEAKESNG